MTAPGKLERLAVVVAVAENGVIGRRGDLPWHLPADLRHFKRLTVGHTLLMGRRTWQSIGRPLPRRRSIVLSRDATFEAAGAEVVPNLDAALELARGEHLFAIGGHSVYAGTLPLADVLHVTRVHATVEGDVTFPKVDWEAWHLESSEPHPADERHAFPFTFERYVRR